MSLFVDIKRSFPDFELSVQLEGQREVLALLGASGCGKSLTLKCIAGIEKPDSGRIVINGETVFDSAQKINLPPQKRGVGYLFQNYALFPNMTVWNNIACVIKKQKNERAEVVDEIIGTFQLERVKNLYPGQISGGQQQRAALARILVSNPKILMLDEPFSALDSHLKWSMEQEISQILSSFKGTTLFVSHDRDEAYRISDKMAVMSKGKIELIGEKAQLFNSPKTLAGAMITGCKNISRAEKLDEHTVNALDWGVTLSTGYNVPDGIKHIGVRAHHFKLARGDSNIENRFRCGVCRIIDEPFEKIIVFSFDDNSATLRFEIPKDIWNEELDNFYISVPGDKIICLQ